MRQFRRSIVLIAALSLVGACGDDSSSSDTTSGSTATPTTSLPPDTTVPPETTAVPATTALPATTAMPATTVPVMTQPAIWPAADVVFLTPEEAAIDFLANVFGEGPMIGAFQSGDQRSGEFEVFASVDGAAISNPRSVLMVRQLGPSEGWFVIAAASEAATVTSPETMATVPAGPLTVTGMGTGFEATIVISAFVAGDAAAEFDREIAMAGNMGEVLPYSVTLDLSSAQPGDIVVLLIRGGTGLETDPGDFGAIPVVII